jgi:predicted deacylase
MTSNLLEIGGQTIAPGSAKDIRMEISETYTGDKICIPIRVIRSETPGPLILITAAIHGDEINGTGIIHDFLFEDDIVLKKGTLILVPVVNVFGFESNERYLPDRRDLNRSFPGMASGSLASRIANKLMTELVDKCDYAIDLHTAAAQRTNYPNVRADLSNPEAKKLAVAFGCALILDGKGPTGSFRREATRRGCPTIILEAGEPFKIEPTLLQIGIRGIKNVLIDFGMLDGETEKPPFQSLVRKTYWVRATVSGILKFHVSPGNFVDKHQPLATNYSILGQKQNIIESPGYGMVVGMTTMPAVKPGEPICNIATMSQRMKTSYYKKLQTAKQNPYKQVYQDLATNVDVVKH